MATGWKPKMKIIGPMPLNFDNPDLDNLIKPLVFSDTSIHEVVYLGRIDLTQDYGHAILSKCTRSSPKTIATSIGICSQLTTRT